MKALSAARVPMRELFSDEQPQMIVLTSLAKGGDQIGAATALEAADAQHAIEVALEVVTPFAEENYPGLPGATRKEFTDEEADEFRRLEKRSRQTICLAGTYGNDDERLRAYQDARDVLLQNSDVLIAVYDPTQPVKPAGTRETVKLALAAGSPVIGVLVDQSTATITVPRLDGLPGNDWQDDVSESIRQQLVLPDLPDLRHALQRLDLISGEEPPGICTEDTLGQIFAGAWNATHELAALAASPESIKHLDEKSAEDPAIETAPYAAFYQRASELAMMYMRAYRGGFVLAYVLAGVAVAAAVLMLVTFRLTPHPPPLIIWTLAGGKIFILVILLRLQGSGRREKLHEAAADFRYLTELLRPMQWLTPLGTYPPAVDLPLHATRHDPRRSWMAWLARAVARSSPSVSLRGVDHQPRHITLTPNYAAGVLDAARTEWIESQVRYHAANARRMHIMEEGMERLAQGLIWVVLLAAFMAWAAETQEADHLAAVLTGIAAVLPAFTAAIGGILFQSEAKRLASRSEAMQHALGHQQQVLAAEADRLRAAGTTYLADSPHATAVLKHLSAITIAEAADWKILYQVHEIHAA